LFHSQVPLCSVGNNQELNIKLHWDRHFLSPSVSIHGYSRTFGRWGSTSKMQNDFFFFG